MVFFDEIAEKNGDDQWDEWKRQVLDASDEIASFVARCRSGGDAEVIDWFEGSFNFCLRVTFNNATSDAIIRFTGPGHTTFQDEKVANEVQVITFLRERTAIPVPRLLSWGLTKDSPQHFGPFIISDFIDGIHLSDVLKDPADQKYLYLNPNIETRILDTAFEQIADILLQLFQSDFPAIGAISKDSTSNTWSVTGRPLTYSMNELATTVFYPTDKFATGPFESASTYFRFLSDQHITHLWTQRNISNNPAEAQEQYIARHQFARLAGKYSIDNRGPFKLFCDDLRPQNMLVDPKPSYASEPPWWLLLAGPDSYILRGRSIEEFLAAYEPRLEQFLQAMQRIERQRALQHDEKSLSALMRESWVTRRFWFNYAARKPFDVDQFYNSCLKEDGAGIELLDEEVQRGLEPFTQKKMEQLKAYTRIASCYYRSISTSSHVPNSAIWSVGNTVHLYAGPNLPPTLAV